MPKRVDKYDKERLDVLHKMFEILGINENNNTFLLHDLDNDTEKQNQILELEPPMTEYKQRLINQTLPGYIQYLYNDYKYFANNKIYVDEFFKNSIEFSKQNHLSTLFSKDIVSKYLSKLDGIIFNKNRDRQMGIYYEFYDINKIEGFLKKENPSYFKYLYYE